LIQLLLVPGFEQKMFLQPFVSDKGTPYLFVVGAFIKCRSGTSWAVIRKCTQLSPSKLCQLPQSSGLPLVEVATENFFSDQNRSTVHYLEMRNNVRKVGVLHNCHHSGRCSFDTSSRRVIHAETTFDSGRFFVLTRSLGYPPRRS